MPDYNVEYKKKTNSGFTHIRQTVDTQDRVSDIYNDAMDAGILGLEFFTVRAVKVKPEKKEAKK